MANIKRKYTVEKTSFPLDGVYNWNVQVWISIDNSGFYYCGIGKYTRTKKEAIEYIRAYKKAAKE